MSILRNLFNSVKSGATSLLGRLSSTISSAAGKVGSFVKNILPARPLDDQPSTDGIWTNKGFRRTTPAPAPTLTPEQFGRKYAAENKMSNLGFGDLQPQIYKETPPLGQGARRKKHNLLKC